MCCCEVSKAWQLEIFIFRDLKRVGEKKIYLMTDAGSEYTDDQLDQICCGLKAEDIELIVM